MVAAALMAAVAAPVAAQDAPPAAKLVAEPAAITLRAGQTVTFKVRAYDAQGKLIPNAFVRVQSGNRAVRFSDTTVTATAAGKFEATAMAPGANGAPIMLTIPVTVTWPALSRVEIGSASATLYAGLTARSS
jgi:plastocyanin